MQVAESETMLTRCKMVLLAIGSTLSSGDIAANAMQRTARRSLARQATKARLHFHDTTQLRGTMEPFPCPALICLKPADNIRRRLHSARQRYVPLRTSRQGFRGGRLLKYAAMLRISESLNGLAMAVIVSSVRLTPIRYAVRALIR